MTSHFSPSDVVKSFKWLGHQGVTELDALDPEYKTGEHTTQWNGRRGRFPRIAYATTVEEVVKFVGRYSRSRMVCYSLNPRPGVLKNLRGYPRAATEADVSLAQNLVLDIDLEPAMITKTHVDTLTEFVVRASDYYTDLGLLPPVLAYTGRGYHLLSAFPGIDTKEHADVSERQRVFRRQFAKEHRQELERLEALVDDTQDLRRMIRIYGTAKPDVGIVSKFYGNERVEDVALRTYLLELPINDYPDGPVAARQTGLPRLFLSLLERDQELRNLWHGRGKPSDTDTSRSGYDYSVISRLLWLGYTNTDELSEILLSRPDGSVKGSGKGNGYVKRTIANALAKGSRGEK